LSNKKNKKQYNKIKNYTPISLETVSPEEVHKLAFQIFGSSYYIDYQVLSKS